MSSRNVEDVDMTGENGPAANVATEDKPAGGQGDGQHAQTTISPHCFHWLVAAQENEIEELKTALSSCHRELGDAWALGKITCDEEAPICCRDDRNKILARWVTQYTKHDGPKLRSQLAEAQKKLKFYMKFNEDPKKIIENTLETRLYNARRDDGLKNKELVEERAAKLSQRQVEIRDKEIQRVKTNAEEQRKRDKADHDRVHQAEIGDLNYEIASLRELAASKERDLDSECDKLNDEVNHLKSMLANSREKNDMQSNEHDAVKRQLTSELENERNAKEAVQTQLNEVSNGVENHNPGLEEERRQAQENLSELESYRLEYQTHTGRLNAMRESHQRQCDAAEITYSNVLGQLEAERQVKESTQNELQNSIAALEAAHQSVEEERRTVEEMHQKYDKQVSEQVAKKTQEVRDNCEADLKRDEAKLQKDHASTMEQEKQKQESALRELKTNLSDKDGHITQLQGQLSAETEKTKSLHETIEEQKEQTKTSSGNVQRLLKNKDAQIAEHEKKAVELENEITELEAKVTKGDRTVADLEAKAATNESLKVQLETKLKGLESQKSKLPVAVEGNPALRKLKDQEERLEIVQKRHSEMIQSYNMLKKEKTEKEDEIKMARGKIRVLNEAFENVMNEKTNLQTIHEKSKKDHEESTKWFESNLNEAIDRETLAEDKLKESKAQSSQQGFRIGQLEAEMKLQKEADHATQIKDLEHQLSDAKLERDETVNKATDARKEADELTKKVGESQQANETNRHTIQKLMKSLAFFENGQSGGEKNTQATEQVEGGQGEMQELVKVSTNEGMESMDDLKAELERVKAENAQQKEQLVRYETLPPQESVHSGPQALEHELSRDETGSVASEVDEAEGNATGTESTGTQTTTIPTVPVTVLQNTTVPSATTRWIAFISLALMAYILYAFGSPLTAVLQPIPQYATLTDEYHAVNELFRERIVIRRAAQIAATVAKNRGGGGVLANMAAVVGY